MVLPFALATSSPPVPPTPVFFCSPAPSTPVFHWKNNGFESTLKPMASNCPSVPWGFCFYMSYNYHIYLLFRIPSRGSLFCSALVPWGFGFSGLSTRTSATSEYIINIIQFYMFSPIRSKNHAIMWIMSITANMTLSNKVETLGILYVWRVYE